LVYAKRANANRASIYAQAAKNPVKFWESFARELDWFKPWKKGQAIAALVTVKDDTPGSTRSGKIMRRLLRDIAEGKALGDTTTLADPAVVAS
jgi:hypothetical protein